MRFTPETPLIKRLNELAEPVCEACGVDLYLVQVLGSSGRCTVRVMIDAIDGVSIDDCTKVSRQLSAVLDVEDPIKGRYRLEVSSPGLDRPLRDLSDMQAVVGQTVALETSTAIDGRKHFTGRVTEVTEENIGIEINGHQFLVPAASVQKAHVQYAFKDNHK